MVRYARPEFAAVDKTALAQNRLAAGIYLTSMGLPFWQAGEEFARTKKGQGNSYRSSPASTGWTGTGRTVPQPCGLLPRAHWSAGGVPPAGALDKAGPAAIEFFPLEQPLVGWRLPAQWGDGAAWSACASTITPPRRRRSSLCPAAAGSC